MDRLLLLLPTTTYRTEDFLDAARTLGVDIVCASEKPSTFEAHAPDHLLTLDFTDPDGAASKVAEVTARRPLRAVVGVDDLTTVAAAAIAERLGLRTNAVAAVSAARDKFQMRQCLGAAGVPVPRFRRIALKDDPFLAARGVEFPCVLKPLALSASRGVIRANTVDQFVAAFRRIEFLQVFERMLGMSVMGADEIVLDFELHLFRAAQPEDVREGAADVEDMDPLIGLVRQAGYGVSRDRRVDHRL